MNDDIEALRQRIVDSLGGYAGLYPSLQRRLHEIIRSGDPFVRELMDGLIEAYRVRQATEHTTLTGRFGLSPKEARIAQHLADGGSVADYAAQNGVSEQTVRSQLKSIFGKTGVNRQSALAALLRPGGGSGRP